MKALTRNILILLVLAVVLLMAEVVRSPKDDAVHLYFLDVGQGDSVLIQKGDYQILVDGGPDDKVLSELGEVMPLSDRKIEAVILTHPHADHLAGVNQVLDRYEVGQVYSTGIVYTSNGYLEFLQKIKDKQIKLTVPKVQEEIIPFADADLTFLWPGEKYKEQTLENLNNSSIVSRFCYQSQCTLLTGDIETDEQAAMFADYEQNKINQEWQSDILKVPHHGSSNGSNDLLYQKVQPKYSVISVGADNKFGHPHAISLELAQKYHSKILRTDRDGRIEFAIGKEGITQVK